MRNPTGFYSSKPHELLVTTPWNGFATSVFEYCGGDGAGQEPIGHSNYNALQVNFNRRERWGLTFMAPYTYSKFLDDVGGPEEWGSINSGFGGIGSIRNFYDLGAEWGVDSTDIPQSVVLNYVYEIPVGRGKKYGSGMNAVENAVAGGWQISGISKFKAGFPLGIGNGGSNLNSVWGGNQHATVVSGLNAKAGTCKNSDPVGHGLCFRIDGYKSETEMWKYGPEVQKILAQFDELRYRLLPYIYSAAWGLPAVAKLLRRLCPSCTPMIRSRASAINSLADGVRSIASQFESSKPGSAKRYL